MYNKRKTSKARPRLGSIEVCELKDSDRPKIVCLYAQLGPGKPNQANKKWAIKASADTAEKRLAYFKQCLASLARHATAGQWKSIAFPHKIGCSLAGGDWDSYSLALDEFAKTLPDVKVVIYKRG